MDEECILKKVLLVTLQGANIGNRLQNYALQTVLKSLGIDVYTPYYDIPELDSFEKKIKYVIKFHLGIFPKSKHRREYLVGKRRNVFRRFDKHIISNMFKCSFEDNMYDKSGCDYAITGSDQVWHRWSDSIYELDYFYLKSFPEEKRISYAASFGFEIFPECDLNVHKTNLAEMKFLSCREISGSEIIYELTGRNAKVLIDPCLLLETKQWTGFERKPKNIDNKKYALLYFLGNKSEYYDVIAAKCKDEDLEIIDVFDIKDRDRFYTTPDEFVWLIHNSQYVFTDSFHATLFSIMFYKKFLTFKRVEPSMEGMYGRIESLFELFEIENHCFEGDINLVNCDYTKVKIDKQRECAMKYLRDALELE